MTEQYSLSSFLESVASVGPRVAVPDPVIENGRIWFFLRTIIYVSKYSFFIMVGIRVQILHEYTRGISYQKSFFTDPVIENARIRVSYWMFICVKSNVCKYRPVSVSH